jgi:hypothetical protein
MLARMPPLASAPLRVFGRTGEHNAGRHGEVPRSGAVSQWTLGIAEASAVRRQNEAG